MTKNHESGPNESGGRTKLLSSRPEQDNYEAKTHVRNTFPATGFSNGAGEFPFYFRRGARRAG